MPGEQGPRDWGEALGNQARALQSYVLDDVPITSGGELLETTSIVQAPDYEFETVLIKSRLPYVATFAYVLRPIRSGIPHPVAILLHGSGMLPNQAFSLRLKGEGGVVTRPDSSMFIGMGLALARAGFTVIAPIIGTRPEFNRGLPWLELSLWGEVVNDKTGRGGAETLLVSEIRAFIDYAVEHEGATSGVFLVGAKEGAYLASVTASIDDRVRGVIRLSSPVDARSYRTTEAGMLRDASFAHGDCRIGDVAQAVMLGGRPLLYATSADDADERIRKPYRNPAITDSLRGFYKASGRPNNLGFIIDDGPSRSVQRRAAHWLATVAKSDTEGISQLGVPRISPSYRFPMALVVNRENTTAQFLSSLPPCRSVLGSVIGFPAQKQTPALTILAQLGAQRTMGGQASVTFRAALDSSRGYRLSLIEFGRVQGQRWRGLLTEPLSMTESAPAILAFNGTDDLNDLFAVGPPARIPYLHGYADALARRGFVVLVPIVPAWVPDAFAGLSAAQTGGRSRVWPVLIDVYTQALDALLTVPFVDRTRVAAYGISFGGVAASLMTAVDLRIRALVYSNIPLDYSASFNHTTGGYTNLWAASGCSVIDAALFAVAPRPLIWEAGEDPLIENGGLDVIQRMRSRFSQFGAEDAFSFSRHYGGHETFPDALRIFGR